MQKRERMSKTQRRRGATAAPKQVRHAVPRNSCHTQGLWGCGRRLIAHPRHDDQPPMAQHATVHHLRVTKATRDVGRPVATSTVMRVRTTSVV